MGRKLWVLQVLTGLLLLLLLGAHLLGNHPDGGLLDYDAVVARLQQPGILATELLFLLVVTYHALNGVRQVLLDYLPAEGGGRYVTPVLSVIGLAALVYGIWLSIALYLR